jgi:hypothetical protein
LGDLQDYAPSVLPWMVIKPLGALKFFAIRFHIANDFMVVLLK